MVLFGANNDAHLIPIHLENIKSKDWIVLLEASTIVGPSPDRLRVASTTKDRKIVWRIKSWRSRPFLFMEGYDPRIHVLYFCPQLYKLDGDNKLVPLPGEEIGRFVAQAVEGKVKTRRPWYEPLDELPEEQIITAGEVDTLVVERTTGRTDASSAPAVPEQLLTHERNAALKSGTVKRVASVSNALTSSACAAQSLTHSGVVPVLHFSSD